MDSEKAVVDELPLAIVRRVVKDKLSECSPDYDVSIHKEALLAFSESARIFIHYLSATANDICKDSRRQTMKAEDVFKALEDMEFSEFLEPLKASLDDFKKKNAGKKAAGGSGAAAAASKPKETKKRKHEEASTQKGVRKSQRDEGDLKNDEEDGSDNTKGNADDNTEENGNNEEEEEDANGNEDNSMEEAGSGSAEDDENEGSGEEEEGDDEDE
ncbi:hypothetical protein HID58_059880 [Brassica napus]|uniref:Transcription factor CBF/NF-Y/archaeal histone domain-containing protein n=1 Tax=Brassica napus TaxID=3708 RepID=A0ABQ7ZU53_BRANA|nr:DNA polymerase epsilon subunit 3 [Brassica napus]KAH0883784.1 hypothetical protein HID58_059880 [Brassica napus]